MNITSRDLILLGMRRLAGWHGGTVFVETLNARAQNVGRTFKAALVAANCDGR
jgi:hypothetical protein